MEVSDKPRAPAALSQGKSPGTHCIGAWVGPRAGLDAVVRRKIPSPATGTRTPDHPARSGYVIIVAWTLEYFKKIKNKIRYLKLFHLLTHCNGSIIMSMRRAERWAVGSCYNYFLYRKVIQ